jgi:peroxiredoxin Q/BCP
MRLAAGLLALLVLAPAFAARAAPPAVGSQAPAFRLQDQNGVWRSLDDYAGKWLVVYFYPKDGTPGCTKQVCAFRDDIAKVRAAGAEVVGVSLDDITSHKAFAAEHKVPFPLLADSDKAMATAYGVLGSRLGMTYARRDTFLIDPQGRIAKHYRDVDPVQNVAQVLQDLALLSAPAGTAR